LTCSSLEVIVRLLRVRGDKKTISIDNTKGVE
jgi:hypothetical protein